jgi:hypothetical protein
VTNPDPASPKTESDDERYIRWQKYQIEQMTFALNLFLGLSVGALAYGVSLVKENGFSLPPCHRIFLLIGLGALAFSTVIGCIAVVSRLFDFRNTARKIRADKIDEPDEAAIFKDRYRFFGKLTWVLFWLELGSFLVGLMGLIDGLYARYGYRLN